MEKLKALMQLDPKKETAAAIMGCSPDTIERRIREIEDLTYNEFKAKYVAKTILSIKQLAHKLAAEGNEKMITRVLEEAGEWSGKGQSGVQVNVQNNVQNSITIDAVDLEDRIKQIKGEDDGQD